MTIDVAQGIARAQGGAVITDNGRLIGFVVDRRDGCDAIAANGRAIGKFNTTAAAARALLHDMRECDG